MTTVLIKNKTVSSWISCQSITTNLIKCYQKMYSDTKIIEIKDPLSDLCISRVIKKLENLKSIKRIVYLEHYPSPVKFINFLSQSKIKDIKLIYHVYGDLTLQLREWIEDLQKNQIYVHFVCASKAQKSLTSKLFKDIPISIMPFPINQDVFFFDYSEREEMRKELNVKDNEKLFCYTGRISTQKNIRSLINTFGFSKNSKLIICGNYDNLARPFIGQSQLKGSEYFSLKKQLANNPQIAMLGNLTHNELRKVYNASDCYINLSTHNDEDYGMSVAEAISCDLPLILTKWGGFKDFHQYSRDHTEYIDIQIKHQGIYPNQTQIIKAFSEFNLKKERKTNDCLSITEIAKKFKKTEKSFNELSIKEEMKKFHSIFSLEENRFLENETYSSDYRKFYESYL